MCAPGGLSRAVLEPGRVHGAVPRQIPFCAFPVKPQRSFLPGNGVRGGCFILPLATPQRTGTPRPLLARPRLFFPRGPGHREQAAVCARCPRTARPRHLRTPRRRGGRRWVPAPPGRARDQQMVLRAPAAGAPSPGARGPDGTGSSVRPAPGPAPLRGTGAPPTAGDRGGPRRRRKAQVGRVTRPEARRLSVCGSPVLAREPAAGRAGCPLRTGTPGGEASPPGSSAAPFAVHPAPKPLLRTEPGPFRPGTRRRLSPRRPRPARAGTGAGSIGGPVEPRCSFGCLRTGRICRGSATGGSRGRPGARFPGARFPAVPVRRPSRAWISSTGAPGSRRARRVPPNRQRSVPVAAAPHELSPRLVPLGVTGSPLPYPGRRRSLTSCLQRWAAALRSRCRALRCLGVPATARFCALRELPRRKAAAGARRSRVKAKARCWRRLGGPAGPEPRGLNQEPPLTFKKLKMSGACIS